MDDMPKITFREMALAIIECTAGICQRCIIQDRCHEVNLRDNKNWWLKYLLDKLDEIGKDIESVTPDELASILKES